MMCPFPIQVKDKYGYLQTVPCGQCIACRLNKAREWSIRIVNELQYHEEACFLTLTYDEDHIPWDYSISKREFQLFMKRFRREFGKNVRYFASGEYGDKGERRWINPHYHVILFGVSPTDPIFKFVSFRKSRKGNTGVEVKLDCWDKGQCFVGDVTYDSACYVARYTSKKLESIDKIASDQWYLDNGLLPPFLLMSRRPGIGAKYVRDNRNRLKKRGYIIGKNGQRCPIPRFYEGKMELDKAPGEFIVDLKKSKIEWDNLSAVKYKKSFAQYRRELLENAKNLVESFIRSKEK